MNKLNLSKMIGLTAVILFNMNLGWGSSPTQSQVLSHIKRISGVLLNTGEVLGIYVAPGLATLIETPCPVLEVTVGNPKDIVHALSDKNPNHVKVYLSSSLSMSSNLIISCPSEVIVLDLYPSRTTHQDYLKIESTYGGPELAGVRLSPVTAQTSVESDSVDEKNLILIQQGGEPIRAPSPGFRVISAPKVPSRKKRLNNAST